MEARMATVLREWADKRGYKVDWYDGQVVRRGFERLRRMHAEGAFDAQFYGTFLAWLDDPKIQARAETRTLILVAIPRPAHVVTFEDGGRQRDLVLPPTYVRYSPIFDEVLADLAAFTGDQLKLQLLSAPLKTIAGLTGFARYGKNNIVYVEGFGSAVQLAGLATEEFIPGAARPAEETLRPLDGCRSCRACSRACPARAITDDGFLIHGERCLTGFSETEGDLPKEFARLRTPTLIGCLACQETCPANRGQLRFERVPRAFSSDETAYLLGERGDGPPAQELADNVRVLGLSDITMSETGPSPIFRRNLRAVLRDRPGL